MRPAGPSRGFPLAMLGDASTPKEAARRAAPGVERRLADRLGPPGVAWSASLLTASRSQGGAFLFRATCKATGRRVAAKLFALPATARAEFEAAQAEVGGAALARPLFCDEDLGLLVYEWVEGPTLGEALAQGASGGERKAGLAKAGRWLRRFHDGDRRRLRVFQPLAVLVEVCDAASSLTFEMPPPERAAFRRAVEGLAQRASQALPGLYRPVRLHGDFHFGNVILSPQGPVGIDPTRARVGPREEDLARMTVQLELSVAEGSVAPRLGGLDVAAAREALLAGYGLRGWGRRRLALREGVELLRRWQVASRSRSPRPGRAEVVQAILARRGWLVLALALAGEALPEPDRRHGPRAAQPAVAAA